LNLPLLLHPAPRSDALLQGRVVLRGETTAHDSTRDRKSSRRTLPAAEGKEAKVMNGFSGEHLAAH
jgi:hypothetical protein